MLLVFDSNVHVGPMGINKCKDKTDWGGKMLIQMIRENDLLLVNNWEICEGVVTRVDPRNGTQTTLDLAICNHFMKDKVIGIKIDEYGLIRPTRYGKDKVTSTDHNQRKHAMCKTCVLCHIK